jgi:hypothetical protein
MLFGHFPFLWVRPEQTEADLCLIFFLFVNDFPPQVLSAMICA